MTQKQLESIIAALVGAVGVSAAIHNGVLSSICTITTLFILRFIVWSDTGL